MTESTASVCQVIQHQLRPISDVKRWVVALSGGLDSTVLLHALVACGFKQSVVACHIHHGLSSQADAWQAHCQSLCDELGVTYVSRSVRVDRQGLGLEDAARQARYRAFEALLEPGDCLLLGHHRDDQAETLLLRLMRGAGPKGLGAMPASRAIGQAMLVRPLLSLSRPELEVYARHQQLQWVEDDSNSDESLDRNYLRQQVMPLLEARWPDFSRSWQTSAQLCQQESALTEALAADDLARIDPQSDRAGASLSLAALQALSLSRRQLLLRVWCKQLGVPALSRAQLAQIEQQLIAHRQDSEAQVQWADYCLRCFQGRLYLFKVSNKGSGLGGNTPNWTLEGELDLAGAGILAAQPGADMGLAPGQNYHIRYRRGGERCRPQGRGHSQTLKKLLQEYKLAPWLRDRVPLVYLGDTLVAVADLWVCEGHGVAGGASLHWRSGLETLAQI